MALLPVVVWKTSIGWRRSHAVVAHVDFSGKMHTGEGKLRYKSSLCGFNPWGGWNIGVSDKPHCLTCSKKLLEV